MRLKTGVQFKMGFIALVIISPTLFLTGCATPTKSDKRVQSLQLKLKKQRAALQDLKERNLVLEKRSSMGGAEAIESPEGESIGEAIVQSAPAAVLPESFTASTKGVSPVVTARNLPVKLPTKTLAKIPQPLNQAAAQAAPTPISVSSEKTGEHFLYSKILDTYRSKNSNELERTQALLMKSYPESVFIDNAIYLNGLLAFENGDYKKAVTHFDRLLRDYPRSNKAVAALYARASCEKRLGRVMNAKRGYIQVRDLYPGSPEAARVSVELKLLESAALKHRES